MRLLLRIHPPLRVRAPRAPSPITAVCSLCPHPQLLPRSRVTRWWWWWGSWEVGARGLRRPLRWRCGSARSTTRMRAGDGASAVPGDRSTRSAEEEARGSEPPTEGSKVSDRTAAATEPASASGAPPRYDLNQRRRGAGAQVRKAGGDARCEIAQLLRSLSPHCIPLHGKRCNAPSRSARLPFPDGLHPIPTGGHSPPRAATVFRLGRSLARPRHRLVAPDGQHYLRRNGDGRGFGRVGAATE